MTTLPPDWTPPPRSLLYARWATTEDGPAIEIGCDCATTTLYVIEDAEHITEVREIAVTCDGCQSVRWITVGPMEELRDA